MSPWSGTLASVGIVSAVPFAAVLALSAWRTRLPAVLDVLVAFGAGALVGAALFHLLPEAWERHPAAWAIALSVAGGALGSHVLERWLHRWQDTRHDAPPPPADDCAVCSDPSMIAVSFLGDAIHNFVDGALIAASFLAGEAAGLVSTVAVLAHELPRELGTFGVFVHYGATPRRAVLFSGLTGLIALAGALLTLVIGTRLAEVALVTIPVAAGSFLYVAGAVLLSQLRARGSFDLTRRQTVALAGGLLVSATAALLGH